MINSEPIKALNKAKSLDKAKVLNSILKGKLLQIFGMTGILLSSPFAANQAGAVGLLGNYPPANDLGLPPSINGTRQKAIGFTLPSGTSYQLDNVVLRLGNYDTSIDTALLQVFSDSNLTSTNPNSASLQALIFNNPSSSTNAVGDFTFSPNGSFTFLANTRYWLLVDATLGEFDWRVDTTITPFGTSPTGIVTFNGYQGSLDNGANYGLSGTFNSFQINATPIPFEFSPFASRTLIGGLYFGKRFLKSQR
jgi:hypothetical protein